MAWWADGVNGCLSNHTDSGEQLASRRRHAGLMAWFQSGVYEQQQARGAVVTYRQQLHDAFADVAARHPDHAVAAMVDASVTGYYCRGPPDPFPIA
jgi:hypothetical protein